MGASVPQAAPTPPDKLDVIGRPRMAKMTTPDNTTANPLSSVVKDAAKASWGTLEAAAAKLTKDKGNFSRDVDAERMTLAQMRELGPAFLAALAKRVLDEYGTALETPQQRIRRQILAVRKALEEIEQGVEFLQS